ncbi:MAG TPA: hypothetical protein VN253_28900, partial [Kofleriaceae bacterium]|nr:hypothetical protein [Kofleriaceae bacterium]
PREPHGDAAEAAGGEPVAAGIEVTACGRPGRGQTVRIVAPDTRVPCAEGQIGEVWLRGPSTACGYLNKPQQTAEVFGATLADGDGTPYLRTGDLGFLSAGTLYLTGRLKDVVIINGRNHYPHDLEATAASAHPWLRPNCGVAFSVERDEQERLVLVYEVLSEFEPAKAQQLAVAVGEAISRAHGLKLYDLVLVGTHTVPKTTSGKLQRLLCRTLYETGKLSRIAETHLTTGG